MELSREKMLGMYGTMLRIRNFEQTVVCLFKQNQIYGTTHVSLGQEAVAVGACAALQSDDYVATNHRGHGHVIARGGKLKPMMAELLGKVTGYCKGKGGSMHVADLERGILGANGIVGACIPIGTGAALASKTRRDGRVTLCFFGDGASNNGSFHECLNMASAWKLPIVYICENNLYAVMTRMDRVSPFVDIAKRAAAYDIPGAIVDGNDVFAVHEAVKTAVDMARAKGGPSLIECKTYRWEGHWVGDPGTYRPAEEVERWKQRDPLIALHDELLNQGFTEEQLDEMARQSRREIDEAIAYAQTSPEPKPSDLMKDIYAE